MGWNPVAIEEANSLIQEMRTLCKGIEDRTAGIRILLDTDEQYKRFATYVDIGQKVDAGYKRLETDVEDWSSNLNGLLNSIQDNLSEGEASNSGEGLRA